LILIAPVSNSVLDPIIETLETKINVVPDTYNDRMRFTILPTESYCGSLNYITGQKMKTASCLNIQKTPRQKAQGW